MQLASSQDTMDTLLNDYNTAMQLMRLLTLDRV
jgi:hypothetical protein